MERGRGVCAKTKKKMAVASPETSSSLLLNVYHNSHKDNVLGPVVQIIGFSYFSTKNIGIFDLLMFFNVSLTNNIVSFKQQDPGSQGIT